MFNKKGFTIVELVIVIAVIAILAAVLIPTFSTVIANAERSAQLQEAKTAMDLVGMEENSVLNGEYYIISEKYTFKYEASTGMIETAPEKDTAHTVQQKIDSYSSVIKYFYNENCTLTFTRPTEPSQYKTNSDISDQFVIINAVK